MANEFVSVYRVSGQLNAETIKLLLESAGIEQVFLSGESIGTVYGLGIGPLAEIEILVPASQEAAAQEILSAMELGKLELPNQIDSGDDDFDDDIDDD